MSLPLEVWHIILDSIHHSDKHTLLSLALVSRVVYAAVLPVLYFDVQIAGHERQERFYRWIESNDTFNPARYVRQYTIVIIESDAASGKPRTHDPGALARMHHLRKLTIVRGPDVQRYIATDTILHSEDPSWTLPELRELRWTDHGVERDFIRFLSRCPAVESLDLPDWGRVPAPPADILPNLHRLSGECSTVIAFLPERRITDIELTSDFGIESVLSYLVSSPASAARIRSLSFPSSFYPWRLRSLPSMLSYLPHLKQLRICINEFEMAIFQGNVLQRLEKLIVFYAGLIRVDKAYQPHFDARFIHLLSPTPLGRGTTDPCLELWYRKEKMWKQWGRSADEEELEVVYQDVGTRCE
ncbi:hypothetical protein CYLTODRAFT_492489 [Cylindrobasidium torrendii FP15055 ss-10]|uniref:F-box domain-containing protein n=1 Tax=Cylindrobasidium torrendii FP15055 ss-10 TaxID=1314674 RepID=A0A0D7B6S8_9AGAR|nr:hypothetical protein CYLTODRAFT_492489 [Cylindrobasidium torrendii FP15055 ss-10]